MERWQVLQERLCWAHISSLHPILFTLGVNVAVKLERREWHGGKEIKGVF